MNMIWHKDWISPSVNNSLQGGKNMESWDMLRELDNLRREVDEAFRGAGFNRPFGSEFLAPIFSNGVLTINVPVAEKAKPRRIEVKAA